MIGVYATVAVIAFITMFFVVIVCGIVASIERDNETIRAFALAVAGLIVLPWLWPLIAAAIVLTVPAWALFTTARVIKHRSLDF